jgi:hypothetical protein
MAISKACFGIFKRNLNQPQLNPQPVNRQQSGFVFGAACCRVFFCLEPGEKFFYFAAETQAFLSDFALCYIEG